MEFNFQIFGDFLAIFLLLISILIPLLESRHCIISMPLSLLKGASWPRMWSVWAARHPEEKCSAVG